MGKEYKCLLCDKTFKRKYYRLKHVRNQHQTFKCDICKQNIKEGSRNVHLMRCRRNHELKTKRCLLCDTNILFEELLTHLKNEHQVWEHIQLLKPEAATPETVTVEKVVENGLVAPPSTPVNQVEQEVPDEIYNIVQELEKIGKSTEETKQQLPDVTEDLNTIDTEDLVQFDNLDFNLFLL